MESKGNVETDLANEHAPLIEAPPTKAKIIQKEGLEGSLDLEDSMMESPRQKLSAETEGTTNTQTLMHLLKANFGTGILAMPIAFKNAGLWFGLIGILLLGLITAHCMHMLVYCSHRLCKRTNDTSLDYGRVMETCIQTGPKKLQRFAKLAKVLVTIFLVLTQFGFCCVYVVFISRNLDQVVNAFYPQGLSIFVYLVIVTVILIPISFIKSLTILAPFSTFANVLTITGLGITFYNVLQDLPDISERPFIKSFSTLPLFFGTAMFTFEGISCVLPLENKMKNPRDFGGWTGVLTFGMTFVTSCYAALGYYGYLKYGETVQGSITLDLPVDWLNLSVRLMFAVAIFISYLIQFYVLLIIIYPIIEKTRLFQYNFMQRFGEYLFRLFLVLCSFGFGSVIPHLDVLIALIGAAASSCLALIFPPIIEMITFFSEEDGLTRPRLLKDLLIVLLGLVGFITGTYASLKQVIIAFQR